MAKSQLLSTFQCRDSTRENVQQGCCLCSVMMWLMMDHVIGSIHCYTHSHSQLYGLISHSH